MFQKFSLQQAWTEINCQRTWPNGKLTLKINILGLAGNTAASGYPNILPQFWSVQMAKAAITDDTKNTEAKIAKLTLESGADGGLITYNYTTL